MPAQRPDITRERCTKPHQKNLNVPIGHAVGKRGPKAPGLGMGVGGEAPLGAGGLCHRDQDALDEEISVCRRDETVGGVMDLFHVLLPYVPHEGAEGPFTGRAGLAQCPGREFGDWGYRVKSSEG